VPDQHETWTRPVDGALMVQVPAGTFTMGSAEGDPAAEENEFPQHTVTLGGFWIDLANPTGPSEGRSRVLRGGCWANDLHGVRGAYRLEISGSTRHPNVGFRCVVPLGG
jgi:formylglycine-generating enzyme required for sulfatase activity